VKNNFYFNKSLANIHSKPSSKSEVISQILYGEKFLVIKKIKNWIKIKALYDNYIGFIKLDKFQDKFSPKYKIFKIKSHVYKKSKNKFLKTGKYLFFSSGISILNESENYFEFEKNQWIKKKDTKQINFKDENFIKIFKQFLNTKYLWGGKSRDGIDCSALLQIYFKFNNKFFPRDTKDQIRYCRKNNRDELRKGDIIFWKGHVGICVNNKNFIHAYGPRKKVLIMPTQKTIKLIEKTAKLEIKKVSNVYSY